MGKYESQEVFEHVIKIKARLSRHIAFIWGWALPRIGLTVEDVFQETIIGFWKSKHKFRGQFDEKSVYKYARTIAGNFVKDELKKKPIDLSGYTPDEKGGGKDEPIDEAGQNNTNEEHVRSERGEVSMEVRDCIEKVLNFMEEKDPIPVQILVLTAEGLQVDEIWQEMRVILETFGYSETAFRERRRQLQMRANKLRAKLC
jgi:RNA polymerase sigma factor (sigma-70 family)